jgi:hypothetical protein
MFGHSTAGSFARTLAVFEVLERRYCFSAAVSVQAGIFADPTPFEDKLLIQGLNTSNFIWGVDAEDGSGSGLRFDPGESNVEANQLFGIGNLVFHNIGTIAGEAASVNLLLSVQVDGKVQTITVPLGIDNTINTEDPVESRDSVFLDAGPIVGEVFADSSGQRMALVILGFRAGGSTISEEFFSDEESEATTQVMAALVPEEMLNSSWLRSSDVAAWQAGQVDSGNDSGGDDSDDSGDDVFNDNSDDALDQADMGDEAWDIELGN